MDEWVGTNQIRRDAWVDAFVIMPDHFHGIVGLGGDLWFPAHGLDPDHRAHGLDSDHRAHGLDSESRAHGLDSDHRAHGLDLDHRAHGLDPDHRVHGLDPDHRVHGLDLDHRVHGLDPDHRAHGLDSESRAHAVRPYLGGFVAGFKSACTRRYRDMAGDGAGALWQRGYYERVIRTQQALQAIRRYIANNPRPLFNTKLPAPE
jgi:REP element-mobilizing transposase RayT